MKFLIKEFLRGVKENFSTILSVIPLTGFGFIILIIAYLFMYNVKMYGEISLREIGMDVFLTRGASPESLMTTIESLEGVEKVDYIKKSDIIKEIGKELDITGIDTFNLEIEIPEILHVTIDPRYTEISFVRNLAFKIELFKGVEEVWYGEDIIERFNRILKFSRYFFIIFFSLLYLSLLLFLYRIFPEHIQHGRDVIAILYLSGLPGWKIKSPFLMLGLLTLIFSSLFALLGTYIMVELLHRFLFLHIYYFDNCTRHFYNLCNY